MRRRVIVRALSVAAALAATVAVLLASAQPVAAHERRTVGPYQLVVGFLGEPAFAGAQNGVDLRITDTRANNKPVEGLEATLRVEIFHAGLRAPLALPLRARFGQPGAYAADFVPTREGSYAFRFVGRIETLEIDERFESGPNRFDEVKAVGGLQYPDQVPSGADLGRRLGDLQSTADQTRLLAIAALVLAALALALPFVRRRA